LNTGVIAEGSERVQWHSMSAWSYCMTHSSSLLPLSLTARERKYEEREWAGVSVVHG